MNLSKRSFSISQLLSVFIVMLFAPAVRMLPSDTAKNAIQASWLTPIPALIAVIVLLLCLAYIYKPFLSQRPSLCTVITNIMGNTAGKIILWFSFGLIIFIAALELRFYGERVTTLMYYDTPYYTMIFFFVAILLLVMKKGLATSVRLCQIVSLIVIVTFLSTFLLSLGNIKPEYIVPITTMDAGPIVTGSVPSLCLLSFVLILFFLSDYVNDMEKMKKRSVLIISIITFLIMLTILMCVGTLGPALTSRMPYPYLVSVKMIKVFESLERIESIVSAVTIISDFALIIMLVFAAVNILKHMLSLKHPLIIANIIIMLVYILSIFIGISKLELESFSIFIIQPLYIIFAFGLVFSLLLVGKLRKKI